MGQHCCVIGGTGFIGRYVVELLLQTNRCITVIGRRPEPTHALPRSVRYLCGDYGCKEFLSEALRDVQEIIDLTYSSVPKTSFDDPIHDIVSNLPSKVGLFDVASELDTVRKIVIISSGGTVYGIANNIPLTEEHPTHPISPYGITKLAIEKYALMYHQIRSLPVVIVRPGNAYGERQQPFVEQGFVAMAIASILARREIVLFGGRGMVRDYIHVVDVASGIIATLDDGRPGTCYNIGTGHGKCNQDVLDVLHPLAVSVGLVPKISRREPRRFDVPVNVLDSSRLCTETGWQATIPFTAGIERTWHWFRDVWANSKS